MKLSELLFEKYDINKISRLPMPSKIDNSRPKESNSITDLADILDSYKISGELIHWILKTYINNGISKWEDIQSRVIPAIARLNKIKSKLPQNERNIHFYNSLTQLEDMTEKYTSKKEVNKALENEFYKNKEATLLYNDANIKVVIPHTEKASCYFGINTRWCTAADNNNQFEHYKNDPLYMY